MSTITTTAGEAFTEEDSRTLAALIYRRFGRDMAAAAVAWRRLLQNNCTDAQFAALVEPPCPTMPNLLRRRRALNAQQRALNDDVEAASHGRAHHQACPLGGLQTGMGGNPSGHPCWCGSSAVEAAP